ncbi:unnamed protein product [Bubo scandiacus]
MALPGLAHVPPPPPRVRRGRAGREGKGAGARRGLRRAGSYHRGSPGNAGRRGSAFPRRSLEPSAITVLQERQLMAFPHRGRRQSPEASSPFPARGSCSASMEDEISLQSSVSSSPYRSAHQASGSDMFPHEMLQQILFPVRDGCEQPLKSPCGRLRRIIAPSNLDPSAFEAPTSSVTFCLLVEST